MKKVTPTLPGSSRMQMPSSSGNSAPRITGASGPISKRLVNSSIAKVKMGKNPYC